MREVRAPARDALELRLSQRLQVVLAETVRVYLIDSALPELEAVQRVECEKVPLTFFSSTRPWFFWSTVRPTQPVSRTSQRKAETASESSI